VRRSAGFLPLSQSTIGGFSRVPGYFESLEWFDGITGDVDRGFRCWRHGRTACRDSGPCLNLGARDRMPFRHAPPRL